MILRDLYCLVCGTVLPDEALPTLHDMPHLRHCPQCNVQRRVGIVCNGGMKTRYRVNDWPDDPEFYRGQIKATTVTAKDSDGEDIRRYYSGSRTIGDPMHDNPKYHNGTEERETKRDKAKHSTRRKRGTLPMIFDQKGNRVKRAPRRNNADVGGNDG